MEKHAELTVSTAGTCTCPFSFPPLLGNPFGLPRGMTEKLLKAYLHEST